MGDGSDGSDGLAASLYAMADEADAAMAAATRRVSGGDPDRSAQRERDRCEALSSDYRSERREVRARELERERQLQAALRALGSQAADRAAFDACSSELARERARYAEERREATERVAALDDEAVERGVELADARRDLRETAERLEVAEKARSLAVETKLLEVGCLKDRVHVLERAAEHRSGADKATQRLLESANADAKAARAEARSARREADAEKAELKAQARAEIERAARLALRESKRALRRDPPRELIKIGRAHV